MSKRSFNFPSSFLLWNQVTWGICAWPQRSVAARGMSKIFAEGLGDNPRQIKRTVNTFLMLWKLAKDARKLKGKIKPLRLAKVVAIQTVYPDLYNLLLKEEPCYLRELEEYYRNDRKQMRKKNHPR